MVHGTSRQVACAACDVVDPTGTPSAVAAEAAAITEARMLFCVIRCVFVAREARTLTGCLCRADLIMYSKTIPAIIELTARPAIGNLISSALLSVALQIEVPTYVTHSITSTMDDPSLECSGPPNSPPMRRRLARNSTIATVTTAT